MRRLAPIAALLLCLIAISGALQAQLPLPKEQPIRMGRYPAVSPDGSRLCFTYQGNLWVAPVAGGPAVRLTANDSFDGSPKWSPDGLWIAFNSDREGGNQVFIIPSVGGPARQVTFHSTPTLVHDWYPDGKSLLVTSTRDARRESIYKLDVLTGHLKMLFTDEVKSVFPTLSPDGKWIAYTRGALVDTIRKGYKGAANYDIFVAPSDLSTPPRRLTDSDKNDMWPVWGADNKTVYYSSERAGLATIWKQSRDGGKPVQVVSNPADAVRYTSISRNGTVLAYECDSRICTTPISGGPAKEVAILCRTDERGPRTNFTTFTGTGVSEFALSPDGKRTAFVIRGDVFVITNDKGGEAKRLTETPGRESNLAWSPDGKSVLFASNRTGRNKLYSVNLATRETKQITQGSGIDTAPAYSPDGKWIAFLRAPQTGVYLIKPDGTGEQVAAKGPKIESFRWSPDNKWITYSQEDDIRVQDVWLVNLTPDGVALKTGKPVNVTDHPGFNDQPLWFSDGTRLAFRSNRYRNRDIETINNSGKFALFTVPLEKEKDKFDEDEDAPKPTEVKPADAKPGDKKPIEVKVDPQEIERRSKQIVGLDEGVSAYSLSPDGKTFVFVSSVQGQNDIWQAGADGGAVQRLTTGGEAPQSFQWSPDSARIYYVGTGGTVRWVSRGGGPGGSIAFTARMQIERTVDYKAALDEGWAVLNDRYYDKTYHGVDWKAVGEKYHSLVDYVTTRNDFNYLFTQMLGELNSSHTGIQYPASTRPARETGYLGIFVDQDYTGQGVKIASIMPRSPADRSESRLNAGEYVVSVDSQVVQADASLDKALTDKVGRTVTLLVNTKPGLEGARTVRIKPIGRLAWNGLLYEKWIDDKRAVAEKASGGRFGYLHVTDMGDDARNRFERELFSIGQRKDGMIIDLRNNNGGDTHDSLLKILERNKHYFTFAPRLETPFPQPERAYVKPIILLTNEASLSDAEVFSNGFKELGLGKVVGMPTMGWIIFTYTYPLIDGSFTRVPHLGCYTIEGKDMELWGVPPDIKVGLLPADSIAGKDPQIERAVEELLKDKRLKK
jgi:tricorn protease